MQKYKKTMPLSFAGGRFVVTSQGDLHIKSARQEDGRATYSCLTRHSLTGETRKSEPASLTVTGMCMIFYLNLVIFVHRKVESSRLMWGKSCIPFDISEHLLLSLIWN